MGHELVADLRLYLASGGTPDAAEEVFRARDGNTRRLVRTQRAIAYLKDHADVLRRSGLLAFGEQPDDIYLARRFADALMRALAESASG